MKQIMLAACMAAFLTACATAPAGDFCDVAQPMRLSPEVVETMTDAEVARALRHNEIGARLCQWKP